MQSWKHVTTDVFCLLPKCTTKSTVLIEKHTHVNNTKKRNILAKFIPSSVHHRTCLGQVVKCSSVISPLWLLQYKPSPESTTKGALTSCKAKSGIRAILGVPWSSSPQVNQDISQPGYCWAILEDSLTVHIPKLQWWHDEISQKCVKRVEFSRKPCCH